MPCVGNQIVEGIIAGDEAVWNNVYREYKPKLFAICKSYLGYSRICEDLIQDTWLDFITHFVEFSFEKGIAPILYQIMRNNCRDYLRRESTVKYISLTGFNDREGQYYNMDISDAGMIWDAYKPKRKKRNG